MLKGKWYQRKDLEVKNTRGDVLKCSHYMPIKCPEGKQLPCVVYCHGNSGSRADASEAAIILLPSSITVFTLDFSGSGLSGGDHVTLGWNEKDDLKSVIEYLRRDGNVSLIGLWGRSMGAVTCLMYGAQDPSIAGIVLDSPFSNLVDLMMEIADGNRVRLPKFTLKFAIKYMRRSVLKKAKFDITELDTLKVARCCCVPMLLGHAVDDTFIQPHHSDRIFDAYMGKKNIIKFEGDHNSPRPLSYFDSIRIFFNNILQPPHTDTFFDMSPDYFCKQGNIDDHAPLPSNLISFEFSNGDPYGPTMPSLIDDDEYVEYPLDSLTDVAKSMEEEDKMFKEAVKSPFNNLGTRHSCIEELSSNKKQLEPLPESSSSAAANLPMCSNDPATPIVTGNTILPNSILSAPEPETSRLFSPQANTSVDQQSPISFDSTDCTKVTVTVIKNPTSKILDGLLCRWDLNFSRNR